MKFSDFARVDHKVLHDMKGEEILRFLDALVKQSAVTALTASEMIKCKTEFSTVEKATDAILEMREAMIVASKGDKLKKALVMICWDHAVEFHLAAQKFTDEGTSPEIREQADMAIKVAKEMKKMKEDQWNRRN